MNATRITRASRMPIDGHAMFVEITSTRNEAMITMKMEQVVDGQRVLGHVAGEELGSGVMCLPVSESTPNDAAQET